VRFRPGLAPSIGHVPPEVSCVGQLNAIARDPASARSKLGRSLSAGHAEIPHSPREWGAAELPALIDEKDATENGDRNGSARGRRDARQRARSTPDRGPDPAAPRNAPHVGHRLDSRDGLVFGRTDGTPFVTSSVSLRASKTWKGAELRPVTLHECRHTFASLMIAAGVNPKALQTFMGHSSITVTLDRYGHLFPGSEEEAAVLLDAYLAESHERARAASIPESECGETVGKPNPSRSGLDRR
jgi:hypothetical protein